MRRSFYLPLAAALAAVAPSLYAQDPVVGASDPTALFASSDPKLRVNKQAAYHLMKDLLEAGHWSDAPKYLTNEYIQHNPTAPDGIEGFKAFIAMRKEKTPNARSEIKRSFADVDFVILHVESHREPGERGVAIVDIFRLEDGKIVEHWDVIQPIPEKAANSNGMF